MSANLFADVADFQRQVLGNTQPSVPVGFDQTRGYETTKKGLHEELAELEVAVADGHISDQVDALIDLIYFAIGGLFQMGVPAAACWNAVHTKNMAKVAGKTHRGTANDAAKPEGWTAPNFDGVLDMPKAFVEAATLLAKKKKDYRSGVTLADYFPFGHHSYAQMLHTKMLRIISLVSVIEQNSQPNFESLRDTLIDMMNYAAFYVEAIDDGQLEEQA